MVGVLTSCVFSVLIWVWSGRDVTITRGVGMNWLVGEGGGGGCWARVFLGACGAMVGCVSTVAVGGWVCVIVRVFFVTDLKMLQGGELE